MSGGATIVFFPQLKEQIYDHIPFGEENSIPASHVFPVFKDHDIGQIRDCFTKLYRFGAIKVKWVSTPNGRRREYWRETGA